MVEIATSTTIDAPPSLVRSILFDWENISAWHNSLILSVKSSPEGKKVNELQPGESVSVKLTGFGFDAKVLANDGKQFVWGGAIPFVFGGVHYFRVFDADNNRTRFEHGEDYSGLFSLLWYSWPWNAKQKVIFEGLNNDLKARAEKVFQQDRE